MSEQDPQQQQPQQETTSGRKRGSRSTAEGQQAEAQVPVSQSAEHQVEGGTSEGDVDEETGLAPDPEHPTEAAPVFAEDAGTVIFPATLRDGDVELDEGNVIVADPEYDRTPEAAQRRSRIALDDADISAIDGQQVEFLTGAASTNSLALSVNGDVYLFNNQMVGALKAIIDKAVVGLAL